MMGRVFRKKNAGAPVPSLADASSRLSGRVDELDEKLMALETELRGHKDKLNQTSSPAAIKQLKKGALEVLKRKRMYEQQRDMTAAQKFNVDQASFAIESARASVQPVAAMKAASGELKQVIRKSLDIDEVDDLYDDMAELMADFHETNEALGSNFATQDGIDEADLYAELAMLSDEMETDFELIFDELEEEMAEEDTPSYLMPVPATPNKQLPRHEAVLTMTDELGLPSAPSDLSYLTQKLAAYKSNNRVLSEVRRGFDRVMAGMANMAKNELQCPLLALLIPAHAQSWWTQWTKFTSKSFYLYFLCAHDRSLVQAPISLRVSREWVKAVVPFLRVVLAALNASGVPIIIPVPILDHEVDGLEAMDRLLSDISGTDGSSDQGPEVQNQMQNGEGSLSHDSYLMVANAANQPGNTMWREKMVLAERNGEFAWVCKENEGKWKQAANR